MQYSVVTGYAADARIASAGFMHGGELKRFEFSYLPGSHLLETLTHPSDLTLTQCYEPKRDLLTSMSYQCGDILLARRSYTYDALGRPTRRDTTRNGGVMHDTFAHNTRSELTAAHVNGEAYSYAYDNIGKAADGCKADWTSASRHEPRRGEATMRCRRINRITAQEAAEEATQYETNALNQYTAIGDFTPEFDLAGNQTLVKTSAGIWRITYNAENRPISFVKEDGSTVVECAYDYMGRRSYKKVTTNGEVTLHQRYLYRGYLQIAACDLTHASSPCLWHILWDPTQPVATRPLAIQKDGTWYTYGWDLTKNICELYSTTGYLQTLYTYTPYGAVTADGDVEQLFQWSSELNDTDLGLIYYNYRHYNPLAGRWIGRDPFSEYADNNLYRMAKNMPNKIIDYIGLWSATWKSRGEARRVYIASVRDTKKGLADIVKLDVNEFDKWAKIECRSKINSELYCSYSVPNTWIAADFLRGAPDGSMLKKLYARIVNLGGNIGTFVGTTISTQRMKKVRASKGSELLSAINSDTWGLVVFGHGSYNDEGNIYYANEQVATTQRAIHERISAIGYKISIAYMMQCYSASGGFHEEWKKYANRHVDYNGMNIMMIDTGI